MADNTIGNDLRKAKEDFGSKLNLMMEDFEHYTGVMIDGIVCTTEMKKIGGDMDLPKRVRNINVKLSL